MRHLDLFSGIGGFSLAASWVWSDDHEIVSFVEIDPFCQKVLKKHWPDVPCHDDIRTYKHDGTDVDLVTGGFPCQPFSRTGKQRGKEDDRYLWDAMLETISQTQPKYILGENVAGITEMVLDQVLLDLESIGYTSEAINLPACSVGAYHERQRIFIISNSNSTDEKTTRRQNGAMFINYRSNLSECLGGIPKPEFLEALMGYPQNWTKIDLNHSATQSVPQCVVPIMQAIKEIDGISQG